MLLTLLLFGSRSYRRIRAATVWPNSREALLSNRLGAATLAAVAPTSAAWLGSLPMANSSRADKGMLDASGSIPKFINPGRSAADTGLSPGPKIDGPSAGSLLLVFELGVRMRYTFE